MATRCVLPSCLVRQGVYGILSGSEAWHCSEFLRKQRQISMSRIASFVPATSAFSFLSTCNGGASALGQKEELSGSVLIVQKAPVTKKVAKSPKSKKLHPSRCVSRAAETNSHREFHGGGIHVIMGPMFAGKSTTLLRRVQEEADRGRSVALVKSDKDTRYNLTAIVTHDGQQMPCYAVPDLATFKSKLGEKLYKELNVIGVDEAQFFPDLYDFCLYAADFEGKTLIVAGLDGDFLRRRFGSTLDLIPIADSVVKLSSICEICGQPASFTFRKTLHIQPELVGGAEIYMPLCRQHFVNGQAAVETASKVIEAHKMPLMNKD